MTLLAPEEEAQRLGSLPVSALHLSVEMRETLDRWGVRTCAALAALPVAQLSERLGQEGVRMQELARGANVRALIPAQSTAQFEETLESDTPVSELGSRWRFFWDGCSINFAPDFQRGRSRPTRFI